MENAPRVTLRITTKEVKEFWCCTEPRLKWNLIILAAKIVLAAKIILFHFRRGFVQH